MFHFRSSMLPWLVFAGLGCLSTQANAFVGVRPPVAEVLPSSALRPHLRALPVDTEAIRLLSGAAGNGAGINTDAIFGGLGSLAWKLFGAFVAFNVITGLLAFYLIRLVIDDVSNDFVESMRDKYPAKLEELQEKARDLIDIDSSEPYSDVNSHQLILLASILDDSDSTNEVLLSSFQKMVDKVFGDDEEQEDSQKN